VTNIDVLVVGHKASHGACQRCGWRSTITRISRRERRELGMDLFVTRVCTECTEDLRALSAQGPVEQHRLPRLAPVRSYNVA
jgi:hypothetical protein